MDGLTQDTLFCGALKLLQPQIGHRIGTDAVLLAAACPPALRICDLGAGVGAVGLRAAQANPDAQVALIERNAPIAALADRNRALNGLESRVRVHIADVLGRAFAAGGSQLDSSFDCVLTNPPFAEPGRVRASPVADRAAAHVLDGALDDWVRAAVRLLSPHGTLVMVHRADHVAEILSALGRRFGGVVLRFVHAREHEAARRVLVRAQKGSRAPLAVAPPLILHNADHSFTSEAAAIHAGIVPFRFG